MTFVDALGVEQVEGDYQWEESIFQRLPPHAVVGLFDYCEIRDSALEHDSESILAFEVDSTDFVEQAAALSQLAEA